MPLVRIDIPAGKPDTFKTTVGDVVYEALLSELGAPEHDNFRVVAEHDSTNLVMDPTYLGIKRSADALIIQVTLNEGRTTEVKKAFYLAVANGLHERANVRKEDVFISLVEVKRENWSFGNGLAQYA